MQWKHVARVIEGGPLSRRRWYLIATAFAAIIIAFVLLRPLLSARWSLIDDHETVAFYDRSDSHGPSWFFQSLRESEAGQPGEGSRYRPAYYFLRIAETGLWRGSARLWWFAHVIKFAISVLLLLWALRRVTGIWENLAATVWIVGAITWWGDIYCRLGPSEAYCVPAAALYAWGAIAAVQTMRSTRLPRYHAWCGVALALGGAVAAGSKENMVFLLLPSMYLVARARWRGSHKWITIGCALHGVFGVFVAIATYIGVARVGHVYKESVSTGGRLALMKAAARSVIGDHWLAIVIALVVAGVALLVANEKRPVLARRLVMPAAVVAFAFIMWLSQVAFYNGWPPTDGRYYFPGGLAAPLAIYACYVAAARTAKFFDARAAIVVRGLALVFIGWRLWTSDYALRAQATQRRNLSTDISKRLGRVIKAARKNPTAPIVCVSNSVWAYEPVVSLQLFLRHAHITNPVYMMQRFTPADFPEGSLERSLAEGMDQIAREGGHDDWSMTRPFAYQGGGGDCIGVGFSGDTGLADCPAVAQF